MAYKMTPKSPLLQKAMGIKAKKTNLKTGETTYKTGKDKKYNTKTKERSQLMAVDLPRLKKKEQKSYRSTI